MFIDKVLSEAGDRYIATATLCVNTQIVEDNEKLELDERKSPFVWVAGIHKKEDGTVEAMVISLEKVDGTNLAAIERTPEWDDRLFANPNASIGTSKPVE